MCGTEYKCAQTMKREHFENEGIERCKHGYWEKQL
jgi:hypothetical protein